MRSAGLFPKRPPGTALWFGSIFVLQQFTVALLTGNSNINTLAYVLSYTNGKPKNQAYCKYTTQSICTHSMNLTLHKTSVYSVLTHYIGFIKMTEVRNHKIRVKLIENVSTSA